MFMPPIMFYSKRHDFCMTIIKKECHNQVERQWKINHWRWFNKGFHLKNIQNTCLPTFFKKEANDHGKHKYRSEKEYKVSV